MLPNLPPQIPPTKHRLAIIGESPHSGDATVGKIFSDGAGSLIRTIVGSNNLATDSIFLGNLSQEPRVTPSSLAYGTEILSEQLAEYKPNCCLLLGKKVVETFHPEYGQKYPIDDFRGTVFKGLGRFPYKSVATLDPSLVLRVVKNTPLLRFDTRKAIRHSTYPEWAPPRRGGNVAPSVSDVIEYIQNLRRDKLPTAFDIEGYCDDTGVTMISLCPYAHTGMVIPFWINSQNYWSETDEPLVWKALADFLADPEVPKIAHNVFYETFVLGYRHNCVVNNVTHDTMMLHWELFPEAGGDPEDEGSGKKKRQGMGRDLGTCASIYTDEPYYKDERTADNANTKLVYNLKDSCVTKEIVDKANPALQTRPSSANHYQFNINLVPAYTYTHIRGCKLDLEKLAQLKSETQAEVDVLNAEMAALTGRDDFNAKSWPQKQWLLYDHLNLKPMARHGKKTSEEVILTYWAKDQNPVLRKLLQTIRKRTRLSDLNKLTANDDGRIRSSYDIIGTNTGRLSSRNSSAMELVTTELKTKTKQEWQYTGTNLQNVTKDLRVCFIPDDEETFEFYQCDLAGADGWTVAADLAALGFPTMLDDYLAGIKPALVLNLMLREREAGRDPAEINLLTREELKRRCNALKAEYAANEGKKTPEGLPYDWQYFCCKKVQHGSNYGGTPIAVVRVILIDSDAAIDLPVSEAAFYQQYYKLRYKTDARNEYIKTQLSRHGYLTSACGIRRDFFNIRNRARIDDSVLREASSFDPQANTTWATNRALERLWFDPDNRRPDGSLKVESLLQIHDALSGQYRKADRDFAHERLLTWFENPITIHGIELTIPVEGQYGPNWKNCITDI